MRYIRSFSALSAIALIACENPPRFGLEDASVPVDRVIADVADAPRATERVRVVEGPAPARPLSGAAVRVVGNDGRSLEAITDASGEAAFDLPPDGAPWSVTVAKRGYAVVSIVGLSGAPEGDIRLDAPIDFAEGGGVSVRGRVAGRDLGASAGATRVFVDALNADPAVVQGEAAGEFEVNYYNDLPGLPLALTALEIVADHPTRIARSAPLPRDGTPIRDITLALPSGPSAFHEVAVPVAASSASSLTSVGLRPGEVSVWQTEALYERTSVTVGRGRIAVSPAAIRATFEVVDGALAPNLGRVVFDAETVRTSLYAHRFDGTEHLAIPTVTELASDGTSLGDLSIRGAADGADAIGLFISPSEDSVPRWRCFFLPGARSTRLPELPTGVTPADLGIGPRRQNVAVVAIWMHDGRAWTTPNSNGAVLGYAATVTTVYRDVSGSWR